jgi:magnesium transporter
MMTDKSNDLIVQLGDRFVADFPLEAAREVETLSADDQVALFSRQPVDVIQRIWRYLASTTEQLLLTHLPDDHLRQLLPVLDTTRLANTLAALAKEPQARCMGLMDDELAHELGRLMSYEPNSAGRIMDLRVASFRLDMTAAEALAQLRKEQPRLLRSIFLVDEERQLRSVVDIKDLALAKDEAELQSLARPVTVTILPVAGNDEIGDTLRQSKREELPVVDMQGHLLGVIHATALMHAAHESVVGDMQAMVGASRDERALSSPFFAVKKRLPWMQINLLTAFLAAAVVGMFEHTIAQVTALAILLPVVAGQSGNAGAQALAVTMRGLALREISIRQWFKVMSKESVVGMLNGLAVAATTGVAVFFWSQSLALALVIAVAMVISMSMACIAGALVPVVLVRLGQDPAQSSSIILTTVTDVVGFFSFLGIATLATPYLLN